MRPTAALGGRGWPQFHLGRRHSARLRCTRPTAALDGKGWPWCLPRERHGARLPSTQPAAALSGTGWPSRPQVILNWLGASFARTGYPQSALRGGSTARAAAMMTSLSQIGSRNCNSGSSVLYSAAARPAGPAPLLLPGAGSSMLGSSRCLRRWRPSRHALSSFGSAMLFTLSTTWVPLWAGLRGTALTWTRHASSVSSTP